jgi:hypothetical protein
MRAWSPLVRGCQVDELDELLLDELELELFDEFDELLLDELDELLLDELDELLLDELELELELLFDELPPRTRLKSSTLPGVHAAVAMIAAAPTAAAFSPREVRRVLVIAKPPVGLGGGDAASLTVTGRHELPVKRS